MIRNANIFEWLMFALFLGLSVLKSERYRLSVFADARFLVEKDAPGAEVTDYTRGAGDRLSQRRQAELN